MLKELKDVVDSRKDTAYIIGDARDTIPQIPGQSVTCWITSPPYYRLKDYGETDGLVDEGTYAEYLSTLEGIWQDALRASKKDASLWIIVDIFKSQGVVKLLPFEIARTAEEAGWRLRDVFIWNKHKALPWSRPGEFRNGFEHILFLTRGKEFLFMVDRVRDAVDVKPWWVRYPERYNPGGKVPEGIWDFEIPTKGSWGLSDLNHPCPFPFGLVERMLLLSTLRDDLVVDPFAGSGSVIAVAAALGRRGIGVELHDRYQADFELLSGSANESIIDRGLAERQRTSFRRRIWKLRKLKYCRELIRLLRDTPGQPEIVLGEVLGEPMHDVKKRQSLRVRILVTSQNPPQKIEDEARALAIMPPLSKYQLDVDIKIHVSQWPWPEGKLWVYTNGRFWRNSGTVAAWDDVQMYHDRSEKSRYRFPIMVSDIESEVDPVPWT